MSLHTYINPTVIDQIDHHLIDKHFFPPKILQVKVKKKKKENGTVDLS